MWAILKQKKICLWVGVLLASSAIGGCSTVKSVGSSVGSIGKSVGKSVSSAGRTVGEFATFGLVNFDDEEEGEGWEYLFDGDSFEGWSGENGRDISEDWEIDGDEIFLNAGGRGDLQTVNKYRNFELVLEWSISEQGSSGILYRVADGREAIAMSGIEYQIIDDQESPNLEKRSHASGSVYDLYAPTIDATRPAGDFNKTRIRVENGYVEHWLNGKQVLGYEVNSSDWDKRIKKSKFARNTGYGQQESGYIALLNQGDEVTFREIKIREL